LRKNTIAYFCCLSYVIQGHTETNFGQRWVFPKLALPVHKDLQSEAPVDHSRLSRSLKVRWKFGAVVHNRRDVVQIRENVTVNEYSHAETVTTI
jgi:hypothetical protein